MNVAMMQPAFIPWLGFFELIYKADCFIFLDDFQFSVQSYHQRNRLFVNKGQVDWYSVPIQKSLSFKCPLNQTLIDETKPWRTKMEKRIEANYAKAAYYDKIAPRIKECFVEPTESLAAQNIKLIKTICDILNFRKTFRFSSDYPTSAQRSKRVLELLRWCEAKRYYCAHGSFEYMKEDAIFPIDEIEILFQNFKTTPYKQIGATDAFVPFLSVIDALMNIGPEETAELIKHGSPRWLNWNDMLNEFKLAEGTGKLS